VTRMWAMVGFCAAAFVELACAPLRARSAPGNDVSAQDLLSMTRKCREITFSRFATDEGEERTIAVCQLTAALYWRADMDIDCDGIVTAECNETTDPWFQPETSATDSHGNFLDAARLPYVVIPLPSGRFDFAEHGVGLGTIVAVIYAGKLEYGVIGDQGPDSIIGEASYALAKRLGINSDPHRGGVDSGVTYIAFSGPSGRAHRIEDHGEAVSIGKAGARALVLAQER